MLEPARIGDIEPGLLFIPFHYGYWDHPERARAANELTLTGWDPVSKEPYFKFSAVRIRKVTQQAPVQEGYGVEQFVDRSDGAIEKLAKSSTSMAATSMEEV